MSSLSKKKPLKHPKAPKGFQLVCERHVELTDLITVIFNRYKTAHSRGGLEVETVSSPGVANTIRRSNYKLGPIGHIRKLREVNLQAASHGRF
uniref:Uncharacterized protein n=1 Tax=Enterobacter phage vB_EclP_26 TaxID=3161160 RepID=A0AAU7VG98_9CAUD